MNTERFLKLQRVVCCALFAGSVVTFAQEDAAFESRYFESRINDITLPDSCKSPYRDSPNFIEFFNTTLYVMAARKGASSAGIGDLFGVLALREKMREVFPNLGEDSPLDRLIIAQVCLFDKIQNNKYARPGQAPLVITPTDTELHTHLVSIAPRLYQDARKLMIEALGVRAKE
ncbi:MAG: hypothetical protein ABIR96_02625, partial [Bdellovibrionota bacterium]